MASRQPADSKPMFTLLAKLLPICGIAVFPALAYSNQSVYEEPFDLAAGGAALTWPSQEALLYINPAAMPIGDGYLRWFGTQFSLYSAKESVELAQDIYESASGSSAETNEQGSSGSSASEIASRVLTTPLYAGVASTVSYIYKNMGFSKLYRGEVDLEGKVIGATGLPEFTLRAKFIDGYFIALALRPFDWLSLGVSAKYFSSYLEVEKTYSITEVDTMVTDFANPSTLEPGSGYGADAGALLFFQGHSFDTRIALKANDIGNTRISGASNADLLAQYHVGIGFTIHGDVEAWHFALDYRDVTNTVGEPLFKRVFAGTKLMFRQHFGLAAGLYQGRPSYGVRFDAYLLQLGATAYSREQGDYPGEKLRNTYLVNIAFGF